MDGEKTDDNVFVKGQGFFLSVTKQDRPLSVAKSVSECIPFRGNI